MYCMYVIQSIWQGSQFKHVERKHYRQITINFTKIWLEIVTVWNKELIILEITKKAILTGHVYYM